MKELKSKMPRQPTRPTLWLCLWKMSGWRSQCPNGVTSHRGAMQSPMFAYQMTSLKAASARCQSCPRFTDTQTAPQAFHSSREDSTVKIVPRKLFEAFVVKNFSAMGAVAGKEQSEASEDVRGSRNSLVSISSELGYSSDHLSSALREKGAKPGPITNSTKAVYARQLARLKKGRKGKQIEQENTTKFSRELEKTLKDPSSFDPAPALALEQRLATEFTSSVKKGRELRGGHLKTSFTYLLLDPRVTLNLPLRAHVLGLEETWRTFIKSVFYVGKGKRSRPYYHLNEAIAAWKEEAQGQPEPGAKIKRILDIWKAGCGVVCLHVFHSVIPVEAHTREAAMIDAIGLSNLCNLKGGEYYGVISTKSAKEQCHFGVHLLRNAMNIFLHEGERQLFPSDIS
ncbi:Hypothetical predicted protein [Cloeon dipterum]|uniref:LEM domain-containing protein n=1 Tax=Cloeon dipterum TaxID=197152 RepID=A0A8S1CF35_9INSE|nr:Hypothetical predicted protein [Cloeon dipterum]